MDSASRAAEEVGVIPFRHEGLGNSAYLLDLGDGSGALIDPGRIGNDYLLVARRLGLRIRTVLETHLHADFVTGSLEVVAATGATVLVPQGAHAAFLHQPVQPGDRIRLGDVEIQAIASPGHTPEHLSYLVRSDRGPAILFSGGSLIAGGAARTDLIDADRTEELTRAQFRTLHAAFRDLPDDTLLMPTHGGGSFCSVASGAGSTSTLGEERASNPLVRMTDEDGFARWFPTTFPAIPSYFHRMRWINQQGPRLRQDIPMPPGLDPTEFDRVRRRALVVDARPMADFGRGHVPGALSNPIRPVYAVWLGWLAPADASLAFVAEEASLERVIEESMLVGFEDFAGYLAGGMDPWTTSGLPVATTQLVDAQEAKQAIESGAIVIDVREPAEYASGHLPNARHVPLGELADRAGELPRDVPLVLHCGHGERALSAASLLEVSRTDQLLVLRGGTAAWREAGHAVERGED